MPRLTSPKSKVKQNSGRHRDHPSCTQLANTSCTPESVACIPLSTACRAFAAPVSTVRRAQLQRKKKASFTEIEH